MQELVQLPIQIQATLVAGFMGYVTYKRDHRKNEKATDMLLLVLLFGMPTAFILRLYDNAPWAFLSIFSGIILALGWIMWGDSTWSKFLYKNDISHTLNEGDVWKTLSSTKGVAVTQIILKHKNGKHYMCEVTSDFSGEPFAPFTMDDDGIAFYVTTIFNKEVDDWVDITDVKLQPNFGSKITYFPRSDIDLLEMRYTRLT